MKYEVEQKFRVDELSVTQSRLEGLGAIFQSRCEQVDRYFRHPCRDFSKTDEAFRLRRVGATNRVTFKGPRLDRITKTRKELELPLPDGGAYLEEFTELLESLGFRQVTEVVKSRQLAELQWQGREVEVCLDQVDKIGEFVEIEIVVEEVELDLANQLVLSLAAHLGLDKVESRGYLRMLLALETD